MRVVSFTEVKTMFSLTWPACAKWASKGLALAGTISWSSPSALVKAICYVSFRVTIALGNMPAGLVIFLIE